MPAKQINELRLITRQVSANGNGISMSGLAALRLDALGNHYDIDRIDIGLVEGGSVSGGIYADTGMEGRLRGGRGLPFLKGFRVYSYSIEIDYADAFELDIQNKLFLFYDGQQVGDVAYSIKSSEDRRLNNSRIVRRSGKALFFRQTLNNRAWFTVRPEIIYDRPYHRLRLLAAWLLAKARPGSANILMYEKESSRYEESASVLFERLVEQGYDNVRYIIDEGNPAIEEMPAACRDKLLFKDSFQHLLEFFRCRTFIGTETIDHSLKLRTANKHVMRKLKSRDLTYVFLQHGVMYMVSLDADMRVGFSPGEREKSRIVVSSEAEANHFMHLGGFQREDLYITGLAKFDRSFRYEDADLIMIMPTWRRWESNEAARDFESTGYYRMLTRMVEAVPEELRDKIAIMPHPLMRELMEKADTGLSRYLKTGMSHDEVLRHTRLLITDYSSIAYDAFYRGANVIFCWEDKDQCMKQYGGASLMLSEYNAFGDVSYRQEELEKAVLRNYRMEQDPQHMRRYERLVAFHDGRNTDRIIEKLGEDMII